MPTVKVKKGDTLNSIVQQHGFRNYREAGVSSVPSGNFDLIRPDEEITFGNSSGQNITPFTEGSPVVSSTDNQQQFRGDSDRLDELLKGIGSVGDLGGSSNKTKEDDVDPFGTGEEVRGDKGKKEISTTGDPILDRLNSWEADERKRLEKEGRERKKQYEELFQTSLRAIDATTNATIAGLNSTFNKRIQEQQRINSLNIARVKAYGLGNGGQYTPIAFSDAISEREIEASNKILDLENQRISLIMQAKQARDQGKSRLLGEKLANLESVDSSIRNQLKDIQKEADEQYKLLRELRAEEEAKHAEAVAEMTKRLSAIAPLYLDDYEDMDESEKDAFLKKLSTQTGVDYATLFGVMQNASASQAEAEMQARKDDLDLKGKQALINQRNASASASHALANQRNRQDTDDNTMKNDVPDTFQSEDDFREKRRQFIKEYGIDGQKYWDGIFLDEDDVFDFVVDENAGSGGGDLRSRVESAGYDYDALKADGYSDEEIEEAIKSL